MCFRLWIYVLESNAHVVFVKKVDRNFLTYDIFEYLYQVFLLGWQFLLVVQRMTWFDRKIKDNRLVNWVILDVDAWCIHKFSCSISCNSIAFMNMSKNMIEWFDSWLNTIMQILTTSSGPSSSEVTMSKRWSMCNQDFGVIWNHVPILLDGFSSLQVETPIVEPWLPWTAPDFVAVNVHAGVFEVVGTGLFYDIFQFLRVIHIFQRWKLHKQSFFIFLPKFKIQWNIMISCNHYLNRMWETIHLLCK